jgi:hypothetical protein
MISPILIACWVIVIGYGLYVLVLEPIFTTQREIVLEGEYKQYETAPSIDKKWSDSKLVDVCNKCGMDDAEIVIVGDTTGNKCKWCAELDNINYHLKYNGVRRFRKAA